MKNCLGINFTFTTLEEYHLSVQNSLYFAADVINLTLGLPTNLYVLCLILTGPAGTMASDFFALNLTMSEILSSMSDLMFVIYNYRGIGTIRSFGQFFAGFTLYGRPLFQCCICVERYLAVVHPVTFLKYKPLRYRVVCCAVVWLMVIGSCIEYLLVESAFAWKYYALSFNFVQLSVMLFCCLAVLRALKRSRPGDGDREQEGTNNTKRRAFRIILTIMISMVAMYLPLILLLILYHFIGSTDYCFGMSICFSIIIICGFVQPLFYLHRAGKLPCIRAF